MIKRYESGDRWRKEHMSLVGATYRNELVAEFKSACKKLGVSQREVIKNAMKDVINKANML